MHWRCLNTGDRTGQFNMMIDERLVANLRDGFGRPTIRFFGWRPWAVSLGFNQSEAGINQEKCASDGIDVVRRPTGGRAILHARELTYSVVMYSAGRSIVDVYHDIGRALVRGLRLFGMDAEFVRLQPARDESGYGSPPLRSWRHVPCFASAARYEVSVGGKKLVGSAQRRYRSGVEGEVVLQHGSILVGPEHRRLVDYVATGMSGPDRLAAAASGRDLDGLAELNERSIELETVVGGDVGLPVLRDCIRRGFEEEWEISLVEEDIDQLDELLAWTTSEPMRDSLAGGLGKERLGSLQ